MRARPRDLRNATALSGASSVVLAIALGIVGVAVPCSAAATNAALKKLSAPRHAAKAAGRNATKPATKAIAKALASAQDMATDYSQRSDVLDYIDALVVREGFVRDDLIRLFAGVRRSDTAARLMLPGATGVRRDWSVYRARFVEPVRLAAGYRFWEDHAALLDRAERDYGVPPEIVVGILGVETVYGRNTGSFRVVDALTTLAFDYPNKARDRSSFFREQLTDALVLSRNETSDVTALRGSYAGAIGMPQFMPGSILRYAVDYDGDGRIDLVGSAADVVGSVANFLSQHGWVRDLATHVPLARAQTVDPLQAASIDAMVNAGSVPGYAYADLVAAGFAASKPMPDAPLALIDLPSGSDANGNPVVAYLAGTQNFHVITRYNRSYFYAYSVIELGSTIKAMRLARSR